MIDVSPAEIVAAQPITRVFSPPRLTLARQVEGRTKKWLADQIDKTATSITQFELGQNGPSPQTLAACAKALSVPVTFFAAGRPQLRLDTGDAHFRSLRATRSYQREQALGFIALLWEVVEIIESVVDLPQVDLPQGAELGARCSAEEAARSLREHWSMREGPATHLVRHCESHGVVVSVLPHSFTSEAAARAPEHPAGVGKVDAFSTHATHRPLIGLTAAKGGFLRRRFNVAHEMGHLLLHSEALPGDARHEREAHSFAAALLLPREEILDELPSRPDVGELLTLQQRWGVSVSALGFRGRSLGRYTDSQFKRFMISLNQLGWRTNEPEDRRLLGGEEPLLLSRALELGERVGLSLAEISRRLSLPLPLVRTFVGIHDARPRLSLVVSAAGEIG